MPQDHYDMRQARYWLCTLPRESFCPPDGLPEGMDYLRGQREVGGETGYEHWQLLCVTSRKTTLGSMRRLLGPTGHYEPSRSEAATKYVWKEETAVEGTRFEVGALPINRANPKDWDRIWTAACEGDLVAIPADVRVRCFTQLIRIGTANARAVASPRTVVVFWGTTGSGKSRTAWDEAGFEAYPKDPRSKWWDGYQGQDHVVIDEFRGGIDIAHVLRWFDRYPVLVETKGGATALRSTKIWITSNLHPRDWYPDLDQLTLEALLRRLEIKEFS